MNLLKWSFRLMALIVFTSASLAQHVHDGDIIVGSTADGSGALAVEYDFDDVIFVSPGFSFGGSTLYTSTEPGFDTLDEDEIDEGFYALDTAGVGVFVEIMALDAGASMVINGITLDAIGESAQIGITTFDPGPPANVGGLHNHPIWQLFLPEGVLGQYEISFKLTENHASYSESEVYTAVLSNVPEPAGVALGGLIVPWMMRRRMK